MKTFMVFMMKFLFKTKQSGNAVPFRTPTPCIPRKGTRASSFLWHKYCEITCDESYTDKSSIVASGKPSGIRKQPILQRHGNKERYFDPDA